MCIANPDCSVRHPAGTTCAQAAVLYRKGWIWPAKDYAPAGGAKPGGFDKKAYNREWMRRYRAKKKAAGA